MTLKRTHRCPCGCGTQVVYEKLACAIGWARLPNHLKADVLAKYRTRASDPSGHLRAVLRAMGWYQRNPLSARANPGSVADPRGGPRANHHDSLYGRPAPTPNGEGQ